MHPGLCPRSPDGGLILPPDQPGSCHCPEPQGVHALENPDAITQLLGPRFLALVPANRNPCLRYHVFGSCTSTNCQFVHKLTPTPSQT
jgi:hypothetical protein